MRTASEAFSDRFTRITDELKNVSEELFALQEQPYWESDGIVSRKLDRLRRKVRRLAQQETRLMREMRIHGLG